MTKATLEGWARDLGLFNDSKLTTSHVILCN